jgi:hypothetical protein
MPVPAPYSACDASFLASLSDIYESSLLIVQLSVSKQQPAFQSRRWHLRGHKLISKQLCHTLILQESNAVSNVIVGTHTVSNTMAGTDQEDAF